MIAHAPLSQQKIYMRFDNNLKVRTDRFCLYNVHQTSATLMLSTCALILVWSFVFGHVIELGRLDVLSQTTEAIYDVRKTMKKLECRLLSISCIIIWYFSPKSVSLASLSVVRLCRRQARKPRQCNENRDCVAVVMIIHDLLTGTVVIKERGVENPAPINVADKKGACHSMSWMSMSRV